MFISIDKTMISKGCLTKKSKFKIMLIQKWYSYTDDANLPHNSKVSFTLSLKPMSLKLIDLSLNSCKHNFPSKRLWLNSDKGISFTIPTDLTVQPLGTSSY